MMILPLLMLTLAFLSSASPINNQKDASSDLSANKQSNIEVMPVDDEVKLRTIALAYQETGDPALKDLLDSTLNELKVNGISEPLKKMIHWPAFPNFWENVNNYVEAEMAFLKQSREIIKMSFWRRPWKDTSVHMPLVKQLSYAYMKALISDYVTSKKTLTGTLLAFRGITKLPFSEQMAYENSLFNAFLYDAENKVLDQDGLTEIAVDLAKVTYKKPTDRKFAKDLLTSSEVQKYITPSDLDAVNNLYNTKVIELQRSLSNADSVDNTQPSVVDDSRAQTKDFSDSNMPCGSGHRSRRSLTSKCLVTEEEYREIVKSVEEEGVVEKIVDTEKYLDLLDRVTAEEPAAKRQQLLELGEKLANDPKVVLEGDYVSQFYDLVSRLEDISQRDPSMPQNPLERLNAPQDGGRLPSEYISPGELHPLSQPEYMHTVNVHEFSAKPVDFHEQIMPPKELPYHSYSTDIFKPREEFSRIPLPEITRVMEIPKPHIPFELPKIERPIFKLTLPTFRRG